MTTTTKDLIPELLDRQPTPIGPKTICSLLLAYYYRKTTPSAVSVYLSHLLTEGRVQRVQHGAYAGASWRPPIDCGPDYLPLWLERHLRDNPHTVFTRVQLNEAHKSQWGAKAPAELVDMALEQLERTGVAARSRNMWMLAPDAPAVDPFS